MQFMNPFYISIHINNWQHSNEGEKQIYTER